MTTEQKYSALLQEIGELLDNKNFAISCLKYEVEDLKKKLEAAEAELSEARKQACDMSVKCETAMREAERLERENVLLKGA